MIFDVRPYVNIDSDITKDLASSSLENATITFRDEYLRGYLKDAIQSKYNLKTKTIAGSIAVATDKNHLKIQYDEERLAVKVIPTFVATGEHGIHYSFFDMKPRGRVISKSGDTDIMAVTESWWAKSKHAAAGSEPPARLRVRRPAETDVSVEMIKGHRFALDGYDDKKAFVMRRRKNKAYQPYSRIYTDPLANKGVYWVKPASNKVDRKVWQAVTAQLYNDELDIVDIVWDDDVVRYFTEEMQEALRYLFLEEYDREIEEYNFTLKNKRRTPPPKRGGGWRGVLDWARGFFGR